MSTDQSLSQRLTKTTQLVGDLYQLLRTQHDLLRQRGISLPPNVLNSLRSVQNELTEMTRRLQEPENELAQLRAVAETTRIINSTLEIDEVLNTVMDTVIELTGAERGYIVLRDEETGEMVFRIARGLDQKTLEGSENIVSETVVQRVAETGEPVVTTNAQEDIRFSTQESVVGFSLRSILCVPLQVRGEIVGVAYADNRIRAGLFGLKELELLMAFANQAAVAIQNARLFERERQYLAEVTEIKELLNNVFASIASGVITTDAQDIVTQLNLAAQRILDVPEQRGVGALLRDLLPLNESLERLLKTVQTQGMREMLDMEPLIPSRGVVNLNLRISPLQDADRVTRGLAIVMDDLTEQRAREARLSAVSRYLPPAMVANIQSIDSLDIGGEQRVISVVSSDVRGFSSFSEGLDPEVLMQIINKYLNVSTDAIHLYEGIVDKYIGDAVVGLYNTQLNPQDDHATRAVRAALSMTYDVKAMHETLPESQHLHYGIGVHTGPAVLGNVGSPTRKEFTALGEAVTLSKLMESEAGKGEVILSPATNELVKGYFKTEPREPSGKLKASYPHIQVIYQVCGVRR
ncbi:MAG: GAF domain-containing protein [Anaerolineae bacterium]|nr:GAF domain-containing protein [Anaerolineae bacterium]